MRISTRVAFRQEDKVIINKMKISNKKVNYKN